MTIEYTCLHLRRVAMDNLDPLDPSVEPRTDFLDHEPALQTVGKCGFRMLLHMVLAAHSPSIESYIALLNRLRCVDRLAKRCGDWVCNLLQAPEA